MQTRLRSDLLPSTESQQAEQILRRCVHCGFCLATCPTYQLTGNELDSPRGRIYLIKQLLEGEAASVATQQHLDRCLTCRACETTCPSGVQYSQLADIGRGLLERQGLRRWRDRQYRRLLQTGLRQRALFGTAVWLGRTLRPLFRTATAGIPPRRTLPAWTSPALPANAPSVIVLQGCVQAALAPDTHEATLRVLQAAGLQVHTVPREGCCGALAWHLNDQDAGRDDMRRMVDRLWPLVEAGAQAIITTASGCGVQLHEYAVLLAQDADYALRAARISALACDVSEVVSQHLTPLLPQLKPAGPALTLHTPCTLQHGLRKAALLQDLLVRLGWQLAPVTESHLCCGSAGTYSLLQPALSGQLRERKLAALRAEQAAVIATANIGCQCHLQAGTRTPVRHWISLLAERLRD